MLQKQRITLLIEIVLFFVALTLGVLFSFIWNKPTPVIGILLLIVALVMLALTLYNKKPNYDLPVYHKNFDIKGESKALLRDEKWAFSKLSNDDINDIINHFAKVETKINKELARCENKEDYAYFYALYSFKSKKVFQFEIYRSYTKYKQVNYVKTPVEGKNREWYREFSVEEMSEIVKNLTGVVCKVNIKSMDDILENKSK